MTDAMEQDEEMAAVHGEWTPVEPIDVDGTSFPLWELAGGWVGTLIGDNTDGFHLVAPDREALVAKVKEQTAGSLTATEEAPPAEPEPEATPEDAPPAADGSDIPTPELPVPSEFDAERWARVGATPEQIDILGQEFAAAPQEAWAPMALEVTSKSDGDLREELEEQFGPQATPSPANPPAMVDEVRGDLPDIATWQAAKHVADAKARALAG